MTQVHKVYKKNKHFKAHLLSNNKRVELINILTHLRASNKQEDKTYHKNKKKCSYEKRQTFEVWITHLKIQNNFTEATSTKSIGSALEILR